MRSLVISAVMTFLLVSPVLIAQTDESGDYIQLSPTPDPGSPTGVYIPKNLDDAFSELKRLLPQERIEEMKGLSEHKEPMFHYYLGIWMRNEWGLWSGSRLSVFFNDLGIFHPDDMSAIILDSFKRSINKNPIDLEAQIEYYVTYWKHNSHPDDLTCPKHKSPIDIRTTKYISDDVDTMRVLHWGKCEEGGEYWVYELRLGLHEPDKEVLQLMGIE